MGKEGGPEVPGFTEIYREFGRMLYGTALRMLGRPEDAEDAVQDAFVSFFHGRPEVPAEQLGPWLRRVVVNECIDRIRRRRRWRMSELDVAAPSLSPLPSGTRVDLERAVAELPERARLVFLLHDVEGYKHREIAEMLGMQVGTTKSQLFRARGLLRDSLGAEPVGGQVSDAL